jgi:hypothetical protein
MLQDQLPDFLRLPPKDCKRIEEFAVVWQIFEWKKFECFCQPHKIKKGDWLNDRDHEILSDRVNVSHSYFSGRYTEKEGYEARFNKLIGDHGENVRPNIETGLQIDAESRLKIIALACVTYRLRNNLFHGEKAAYNYEGQSENLKHAIAFMNATLTR